MWLSSYPRLLQEQQTISLLKERFKLRAVGFVATTLQ
jgi:hypothetical protein